MFISDKYISYIFSKEVLNPNIAYDLEILRPYLKCNDACSSVPQVYTDKEEREAAINYLKNRYVAEEEPLIEVSKSKKKMCRNIFRFITLVLGADLRIDLSSICGFCFSPRYLLAFLLFIFFLALFFLFSFFFV